MDDVDELIDRCREKLGEPDGVYRPAPLVRRLLTGGGLLAGGLAFGGAVLWAAPGLAGALSKVLFAAPVLGGVIIWQTLAARGRAVLTYPDGLLPVGRGAVAWVPWAEVGPVRLRAKDGQASGDHIAVGEPKLLLMSAKLTVGPDGEPPQVLVRPALVGYAALAARVQRERFAHRWPAVRERFAAGEAVGFGAFDVSADGLGRGSKVLAWDRVKAVELKGGKVNVKRRGRWLAWASESLEKVHDPAVFLALVAVARRAAEGGGERGA